MKLNGCNTYLTWNQCKETRFFMYVPVRYRTNCQGSVLLTLKLTQMHSLLLVVLPSFLSHGIPVISQQYIKNSKWQLADDSSRSAAQTCLVHEKENKKRKLYCQVVVIILNILLNLWKQLLHHPGLYLLSPWIWEVYNPS